MEILSSIIFIFFLTYKGCTANFEHISGAVPAKKGQFPFFVQFDLLYVENEKEISVKCGATLIHWQWILTAALCFPKSEKAQKQIELNELGLVFMGPKLRYGKLSQADVIKEIHIHPLYQQNVEYDGKQLISPNNIAVAKLKKGFKQSKYVTTMFLSSQDFKSIINKCGIGIVVGIDHFNRTDYVIYATTEIKLWKEENNFQKASSSQFYSNLGFEGGLGGPYFCYRPHYGKAVPVQYGIALSRIGSSNLLVYEAPHKHLDFIFKYVKKVQTVDNNKKQYFKTRFLIKATSGANNNLVSFLYKIILFLFQFIKEF